VVGVGINWTNAVPAMGINLKTALGKQTLPPLAEVAAMTLQGLALGYQTWQHHGVQAFLPEYISLLTYMAQPMTHPPMGDKVFRPGSEQKGFWPGDVVQN